MGTRAKTQIFGSAYPEPQGRTTLLYFDAIIPLIYFKTNYNQHSSLLHCTQCVLMMSETAQWNRDWRPGSSVPISQLDLFGMFWKDNHLLWECFNEKNRCYNAKVIEVEKGAFTLLVFSTTGRMEFEGQKLLMEVTQKIDAVTGQYSQILANANIPYKLPSFGCILWALCLHHSSFKFLFYCTAHQLQWIRW